MQEYSVSLRQGDYSTLLGHGNIEQIPWGEDFISVLVDDECYDSVAGIVISNHWVEETQTAYVYITNHNMTIYDRKTNV